MIININDLDNIKDLNSDICIDGSGPTDTSFALEFLNSKYKVILLEAGGYEYSDESQNIYKGVALDNTTRALTTTCARWFGGTSNY